MRLWLLLRLQMGFLHEPETSYGLRVVVLAYVLPNNFVMNLSLESKPKERMEKFDQHLGVALVLNFREMRYYVFKVHWNYRVKRRIKQLGHLNICNNSLESIARQNALI